MNYKKTALAVCLSLFISISVFSQGSTRVVEGVILFQSESHLVRMTDKGKILAFIKDVDNNYSALNSMSTKEIVMDAVEIANSPDLGRVTQDSESNIDLKEEARTEVAEEAGEGASGDEAMALDGDITGEVSPEEEMEGMVAEATGMTDEEMVPKGAKETNYDFDFAFDHRDASLSPSVVNQLRQVSKILKEDAESKAEIKSFYSETVDVSKVLSKNRAKGIQDQLVANGIERSRIRISESNNEDWANNRVQLSIY